MNDPAARPAAPSNASEHKQLAWNTLLLVGAQFLTTPLSIVLNMLLTRRLGAEEFGTMFLAANLCGLAFLFVDWGQSQSIAGATAREPALAGRLLSTGQLLKLGGSVLAVAVLWVLARLLHYPAAVQVALMLTCLQTALNTLAANYAAVLRGHERLDRVSQLTIFSSLFSFAVVVPVLLLGGQLVAVLAAQSAASAVTLALYTWRAHQLGMRHARPETHLARELMGAGSGFLLLGVVLALQPALDSVILSKLSPAEVVGWHSAARRFIGFLIFPATTLNFALYPTLARVQRADPTSFNELTRAALRAVVIFGVPAAVGCGLYAALAIRLFSGPAFSPAAPVLQVLSIFVFFVYFSIILGAALAALDRQFAWATVQFACVLVSIIGDPLLVPWCQHRYGNGAIGISATSAFSELLMVAGGIWLAPRGLIDRSVLIAILRCLLAGGAMTLVGLFAAPLPWPLSLTCSIATYLLVLGLVGGLKREQVGLLVSVARRKFQRFTPARWSPDATE